MKISGNLFSHCQDTLEYKKKQRPLKIRMLDGTVKTVMVDDSKIVSDMLMTICARIGQLNLHLVSSFFLCFLPDVSSVIRAPSFKT